MIAWKTSALPMMPEAPVPLTIEQALNRASLRLQRTSQGEPLRLARLALQSACRVTLAHQLAYPDELLGPADLEAFRALVDELEREVPLAYLTGVRRFLDFELEVTPDVLIPRPETELLAESALALVPRTAPGAPLADVGTGSGALALALARACGDRKILALDISPAALAVAARNAAKNEVSPRLRLLASDLLSAVAPRAIFGLIVSNPPYVLPEEFGALPAHVRDNEPRLALVPPEPLPIFLRRLARQAFARLLPGGFLLLEMGANQESTYRTALEEAGFAPLHIRRDLAGLPRVIEGVKPR